MLAPIVFLALLPAALATLNRVVSAIALGAVFFLWLLGLHGIMILAILSLGIVLAAMAPSDGGARPPARPAPAEPVMRSPDDRAAGTLRADPTARW